MFCSLFFFSTLQTTSYPVTTFGGISLCSCYFLPTLLYCTYRTLPCPSMYRKEIFMIAYHIDRYNSLHTGQEITLDTRDSNISSCLFDGKVSKHGAAYLNACCASDFCSFMIEYEFELIRQSFFPHNISRYQSFFAFKNIEDIIYWPEFLVSGYKIYEVEFFHDNCKSYDASYLIGGPNFNNDLCWVPSITFDSDIL